jgi:hypothetical protein
LAAKGTEGSGANGNRDKLDSGVGAEVGAVGKLAGIPVGELAATRSIAARARCMYCANGEVVSTGAAGAPGTLDAEGEFDPAHRRLPQPCVTAQTARAAIAEVQVAAIKNK